jgi:carbonic anhydrase/acetyltransferase-like protein (isoleucine patch superfamily)
VSAPDAVPRETPAAAAVRAPTVDPTAFVHPLAAVLGDVHLGARASVWPFAVLRGDTDRIVVGPDSNVQDGAVVHVDRGVPATIGARVAIGHRAIVHGATIEDDCLVGMAAVVLNRVVVGRGSIIAAGAVVPERTVIPPHSLVIGVPGRVTRRATDEERSRLARTVESYLALQDAHRRGLIRGVESGPPGAPAAVPAAPAPPS